jgi:hypothetical protein
LLRQCPSSAALFRKTWNLQSPREIARLCGYLPLAMRIAGAKLRRKRHWRPATLAKRLADEHRRLIKLTVGDLEDADPPGDAGQVAEQVVTRLDLLHRLPAALPKAGDFAASRQELLQVVPVKRSSQ